MSKPFYRVRIKNGIKLDLKHRRLMAQRVKDYKGDTIFNHSWKSKACAEREAHWIECVTGVPMEVGEYFPVSMKVL
jgi:hypothetical protein